MNRFEYFDRRKVDAAVSSAGWLFELGVGHGGANAITLTSAATGWG